MSTYHNMFTNIFSQVDDGSTALVVFADVNAAKTWFFTDEALSVIDNHTSRVEYALIADENGDNTKLKKTEGFDMSGIGDTYNTAKTNLINAGNWAKNGFTREESEDHLF